MSCKEERSRPSSYRYVYGRRVLRDFHNQLGLPETKDPSSITIMSHGGRPICIIGAGLSGLYTAMILDSLGLKFEILEASDRIGGRLFTHGFSDKADVLQDQYDYFDVGVDRLPKIPSMKRVFDLLNRLNIKAIPCQIDSENSFLYFNGHRIQKSEHDAAARPQPDHFHFAQPAVSIPAKYVEYGYNSLLSDAMEPFRQALKKDLKRGLDMLVSCDSYSARSYMAAQPLLQYPDNVIRWCDMMKLGSGDYNIALVEKVLDFMAYESPSSSGNLRTTVDYYCIDGGMQTLTEAMMANLQDKPIKYSMHVSGMSLAKDKESMTVGLVSSARVRPYSHIICSIPLPCLRTLDLDGCYLDLGTKHALRDVQYSPAIKIGIKFRENWWGRLYGIVGGESLTDLPSQRIIYPSYGCAEDSPKSKVLVVSYCRGQDALRLGAMMTGPGTSSEQALLDIAFRDLASVHGLSVDEVKGYYDWHYFPYDWARQPLSMGASPVYGPGQFKETYPYVSKPAAGGRLHFIGDGTSANHQSISGALESAWRAVYEVLLLSYPELLEKFKCMWGQSDEFDDSLLKRHIAAGLLTSPSK